MESCHGRQNGGGKQRINHHVGEQDILWGIELQTNMFPPHHHNYR